MAFRIELSADVVKQLKKLDKDTRERLIRFLKDRVQSLEDPRAIGEALRGGTLGELWRYRVGDYRIICRIEDDRVLVLVLRIGHRSDVYKKASG